jgi:CBS domain-containing protein
LGCQELLTELLERHPCGRFPAVLDGELKGIAAGTASGQPLKLEPAMTCRPGAKSQALLIQSTTGAIAITDDTNKLLGIVTLHDLLRA